MLPIAVPSRPRRAVVAALPVLIVSSFAVGSLAVVGAAADSAPAPSGTFEISSTPVALNQAGDPGLGVLAPAADAAEHGMFGPVADWPLVPIHAAVARTGHLVTFGAPLGSSTAQGGLSYDDWDPSAGFGTAAHRDTDSMHSYDSFCNSLVELADGRLLMVGGNSSMSTMLYDPATGAQTTGADLNDQRWYATTLRLPDDRIVVLGGGKAYVNPAQTDPSDDSDLAMTPEIGDGTGAWRSLTGATSAYAFDAEESHWRYPRAFNAPDGSIVGFSGSRIWTMTTDGTGSLVPAGTLPFDPGVSESQVMYAPGKILIAGGGEPYNGSTVTATSAAAVLDATGSTPTATATGSMTWPRNWLNLTVLPTGEVLANGGTRVGTDDGDANSMKQAEVWNPASGTWRLVATAQRTRTYHSTALLLPSGAVFTGGGGLPGPETNLNAELYYPAYLFTRAADGSVRWADRPAITQIAGSATWGGTVALSVRSSTPIASASLISLPSVTHGENTDQRRIPLPVQVSGSTVRASLPAAASTMPPGDYELTVVDAQGVPSAAQIVTVRRAGPGLVTVAARTSAPVSTPAPTMSMPSSQSAADPTPATSMPAMPAPSSSTSTSGPASSSGAPTDQPSPSGASASTGPRPPATPRTISVKVGASIGLESSIRARSWIRHVGSRLVLAAAGPTPSSALQRSTTWLVRAGLSKRRGAVSFESLDRPGYFLVAGARGSGALVFAKRSPSSSFAARASFTATKGLGGSGTSFRLTAHSKLVLRSTGLGLALQAESRSRVGKAAATFLVRAPWSAIAG